MIQQVSRYILSFVFLVLLQALVLNNIQVSGYINPYLYVLFILSLPLEIPGWLLLVSGFVLGLSIDLFTSTPGMHTSASVFTAFCRPYVIRIISPRDGFEAGTRPVLHEFGIKKYLTYATLLILLHHIFLFYVEIFRFSQFFQTLGRALLSAVFTLILVIIAQLLTYKSSPK